MRYKVTAPFVWRGKPRTPGTHIEGAELEAVAPTKVPSLVRLGWIEPAPPPKTRKKEKEPDGLPEDR
jgi:hypothetical protein